MKHTKREWMPLYSFLDRKRVTDHLADMAARGWMLDRLGTWSWHYRADRAEAAPVRRHLFRRGRAVLSRSAGGAGHLSGLLRPSRVAPGGPAPTRYRCFTARIRRPFPSTPTRRRSWRTSDGALESP